MKSAVRFFFLFLFFIMAVTALSVYLTRSSLLPTSDYRVVLDGLTDPVMVAKDETGVPVIRASQLQDAFRSMGYLHARDRLWQMTRYQFQLEANHAGNLHEMMIDTDRFYMTLGFGNRAREAYENRSDPEKELLEAYADGVNQWVSNNSNRLPVEFTLSGAKPAEWKPWHSLGVLYLWAWQYHRSFPVKAGLASIQDHTDAGVTRTLTGLQFSHQHLFGSGSTPLDSASYRHLLHDLSAFSEQTMLPQSGMQQIGMALSGSDPEPYALLSYNRHSPLLFPDKRYFLALDVDGIRCSGTTLPGFPGIISGENGHIAWAAAPLPLDDGDFFTGELFKSPVEKPVDWITDPLLHHHLHDHISVERPILVMRDGSERQIVVRRSGNRPIVSISESHNRYLAYDWAGFHADADLTSWLRIMQSENSDDLREAASILDFPSVELLFCVKDGTAGRFSGGQTFIRNHPLRLRRFNESATLQPASRLIPEVIQKDGKPVFFFEDSSDSRQQTGYLSLFLPPWKPSVRYEELLQSYHEKEYPSHFTPSGLLREVALEWSTDTYSPFAAALTPLIVTELMAEPDSTSQLVLPYLLNWNYHYGQNETASTLFEFFMIKATGRLYRAWLDDNVADLLLQSPEMVFSTIEQLLRHPRRWPVTHPQTRQDWIRTSMTDAVGFLSESYGPEPHEWQWGRIATGEFRTVFPDQILEHYRSADLASRYLYPSGKMHFQGSSHTLNATSISFTRPYRPAQTITMRHSVSLQPYPVNYFILSTGHSENIFAEHSDDHLDKWINGRMHGPLRYDEPHGQLSPFKLFKSAGSSSPKR